MLALTLSVLGLLYVSHAAPIDFPSAPILGDWIDAWGGDEACNPFYNYLEQFVDVIPSDGTCFPVDETIVAQINEWFADKDIGDSEITCQAAGLSKDLCNAMFEMADKCSCTNLSCFGKEMEDTLKSMGTLPTREECRTLINGACTKYDDYANIVCPLFESSIRVLAEVEGGTLPVAKILAQCDVCPDKINDPTDPTPSTPPPSSGATYISLDASAVLVLLAAATTAAFLIGDM